MWTWFQRLWDYLRRLIVGDDEGGIVQGGGESTPPPAVPGRTPPSMDLGRELQRFFIELLRRDHLRRFQSGGRVDYVEEYLTMRREELAAENDGTLTPEDEQRLDDVGRLLHSDDLREIESHIGQITGSGRAVIQYVVCPPM